METKSTSTSKHVIFDIHTKIFEVLEKLTEFSWLKCPFPSFSGAGTDFEKLTSVKLSYYGESYDYFSIMHYESAEGSRNGKNTIEARIQAVTPLMGRSVDFSLSDINRINRAYKC